MIKMKRLPEITRGDPVQVRFATHDGYIWNDATVNWVDPANNGIIGVTFADFRKKIVEPSDWRHPEWRNHRDTTPTALPHYES